MKDKTKIKTENQKEDLINMKKVIELIGVKDHKDKMKKKEEMKEKKVSLLKTLNKVSPHLNEKINVYEFRRK